MISQDVHIYSCQIRRASNKTVVPMTKKLEKTYKGSCCPAVFSSANILRAKPLTQPNCNQNLQVWPAWFFFFFSSFISSCLCCCMGALSNCSEQGLLSSCSGGLLIEVASLVVEHGLQVHTSSVVATHGLSCPGACGIFPDQGLNPCPLQWQGILNHWTTREVLGSFYLPSCFIVNQNDLHSEAHRKSILVGFDQRLL